MPRQPIRTPHSAQTETDDQQVARAIGLLQGGQLVGAEELLTGVVERNRRHADAHNMLGVVMLQRGQLREAKKLLRRAVKLNPRLALAHNNLGETLRRGGDARGAVLSFRKALKCDPSNADARNNLGITLLDNGDFAAAVQHLEAAAEAPLGDGPGDGEVIENLARALHLSGDHAGACARYRTVVALTPRSAGAHNGLGVSLRAGGLVAEAQASFERAVELDPRHAGGWKNLGLLHETAGTFGDALAAYEQLAIIDPQDCDAHRYCGDALRELGRMDDAIAAYERGLACDGGAHQTWHNLGNARREMGDAELARAAYLSAIERGGDAAMNWQAIAAVQRFEGPNDDLAQMQKILDDRRTPVAGRMHLNFAIGKAKEDFGDFSGAFRNIQEANTLQAGLAPFDEAADEALFADIKTTFNRNLLSARAGDGAPDNAPIFVLGLPRSGTTLVEQILSSHSDVHGAGELPHVRQIAQSRLAQGCRFPDGIADLAKDAPAACGAEYVARLRQSAGDTMHVTDKLPHNFLYVGFIHLMLPNAKIILCERDPRDTCLSLFKTYFHSGQSFSCNLETLGRYFARYADLMAHWDAVLPGRMIRVSYEQLVDDQEAVSRELLERCGLDWQDACLAFHTNRRRVDTVSADQVRRPMYRGSVGAWKRYGDDLAPLLRALGGAA